MRFEFLCRNNSHGSKRDPAHADELILPVHNKLIPELMDDLDEISTDVPTADAVDKGETFIFRLHESLKGIGVLEKLLSLRLL